MLLSGRPSRLPAVKDIVVESGAIAPHRVIAMHDLRVAWYPFRSRDARIEDPKTTAAVGGMICLLTEGHVTNFNFRGDRMSARSVARYLGKIESSNRLAAQDVLVLRRSRPRGRRLDDARRELRVSRPDGARRATVPAGMVAGHAALHARLRQRGRRCGYNRALAVQLSRTRSLRRTGAAGPGELEMNDRLQVARVDNQGPGGTGKEALFLRLQTLRSRDGYWLDTGVLINV